jgi:hypothetical protein
MSSELSGFKFIEARTSIIFEEVTAFEKLQEELNKNLADIFVTPGEFFNFKVVPNPLVPRLRYFSKNGHSSLELSSVSAQVMTKIDNVYEHDYGKISEYCGTRQTILETAIGKFSKKIKYVGFSVKLHKSFKVTEHGKTSESVGKIINTFYNSRALMGKSEPIEETSFKVAFIENQRYFMNFQASNYRTYTMVFEGFELGKPPVNPIMFANPSLKDWKVDDEGIEIFLDANNKFMYERVDPSGHRENDFGELLKLVHGFIDKNIAGDTFGV